MTLVYLFGHPIRRLCTTGSYQLILGICHFCLMQLTEHLLGGIRIFSLLTSQCPECRFLLIIFRHLRLHQSLILETFPMMIQINPTSIFLQD